MMRFDRRGFTVIELLTIILITSVLAAIAVPKFARMRDRAHTGTLVSDLRNLTAAQERHFADSDTYAADAAALDVRASAKVTITIANASAGGWQATATHASYAGKCEVFVGNRVTGTSKNGVPVCSGRQGGSGPGGSAVTP